MTQKWNPPVEMTHTGDGSIGKPSKSPDGSVRFAMSVPIPPAAGCDMEKAQELITWWAGYYEDGNQVAEKVGDLQIVARCFVEVDKALEQARKEFLKHAPLGRIVGFGSQAYECRLCRQTTETWQSDEIQHKPDCIIARIAALIGRK